MIEECWTLRLSNKARLLDRSTSPQLARPTFLHYSLSLILQPTHNKFILRLADVIGRHQDRSRDLRSEMTSHRKRGRGKRPRDETSHENPPQSFAPINNSCNSTSSYTNSSLSQGQSFHIGSGSAEAAYPRPQSQSLSNTAPVGKVAIPALRPLPTAEAFQGSKKGRTSHACNYCRKAKAGCTGGQPCMRCKNADVECVYGDGKRDRERKLVHVLNRRSPSHIFQEAVKAEYGDSYSESVQFGYTRRTSARSIRYLSHCRRH